MTAPTTDGIIATGIGDQEVGEITEILDRDASMPLYLQLAGLLRGKIKRGEWRSGQKIPSENELNRLYGVSRMTARQVLAQLVLSDELFRHVLLRGKAAQFRGILFDLQE